MQRWREAEQETGHDRGNEREDEDPRIERGELRARKVLRAEVNEQWTAPNRERHRERGTDQTNEKTLSEELTRDAAATSTQGRTDRDLTLTCFGARQKQIGDVR